MTDMKDNLEDLKTVQLGKQGNYQKKKKIILVITGFELNFYISLIERPPTLSGRFLMIHFTLTRQV